MLRAITLTVGNCESVPISLSVDPSLRYSLFGSAVAFTNGSTAIDVTFCASDFPRAKYVPAAATIITTTATTPAIMYLCDFVGAADAAAIEAELAIAPRAPAELPALAGLVAPVDRPESKSRFSRA